MLRKFALGVGVLAGLGSSLVWSQTVNAIKPDSYRANNREPDPRFKADILLVVAHPDDEVMATAYLARAIFEQHKRVAVVYQTAGDGGNNDVGPEQAAAMGDIRQMEARRAVGSLDIENVWFLGGHDTPSQNVLASLAHCSHGHCLDELVRIMRITRPTVVLTWLPDFMTGENHGDHQASGVLATEAFDLAGDPTAFSEQVTPATDPSQNANLTEGLRPWQPEKLYYFANATHDVSAGLGPQYSSSEVSPSRHKSYGLLAAEAFTFHQTQGGLKIANEIADHTLDHASDEIAKLVTQPTQLIFGKSRVVSGITDDVFTGVVPEGVAFAGAPGFAAPAHTQPFLALGDPWNFYRIFWQAHGLDHLANIVPAEISVHTGRALAIPLAVENPSGTAIAVSFSVKAPPGWKIEPVAAATVAARSRYFLRVLATAPEDKVPGWQNFEISSEAAGKTTGTVPLRAALSSGWVAPQ